MRLENFVAEFDFIDFINECINACNISLVAFPQWINFIRRRKFYLELKKGYIKKGFTKMDKLNIYTLRNKDGVLYPYFMTSTSHEEIKKFSVDYFSKMVDSVKNLQEKRNMLEDLRTCSFVCIGSVALDTGKMYEDLQTLYTLDNFRSDIVFDDLVVETDFSKELGVGENKKEVKQMTIEDFGVEVENAN